MRIYKIAGVIYSLLISASVYSQSDTTESEVRIFQKVEKEAAFPGGEQSWRKFLEKNLNPNVPVDHGAPAGIYTVMVQFVVNKEGIVSDIKALTNQGYGMEQEVLRILRKSGSWEPAMQDGKPVNAYRKQPVTFQVMEEGLDISAYSVYADQDNEISIEVEKVKNEDMDVTISRGTVTHNANGKFIVHVTGTERVVIKIYNTKKKNKEIGSASLEVRQKATSGGRQ